MDPFSVATANHKPPPKRWWIVFGDSIYQPWWSRLIPGGMQHVVAIHAMAGGFIFMADPRRKHLDFSVLHGSPAILIRDFLARGLEVFVVEREFGEYNPAPTVPLPRIVSCATIVAYLLGLDRLPATPRGLRRILVDDYGAKEIRDDGWPIQQAESAEGGQGAGAAPEGSTTVPDGAIQKPGP